LKSGKEISPTIIILGATGDLIWRKLISAITKPYHPEAFPAQPNLSQ